MKKFRKSKKIIFLILVLLIAGLFIYSLLNPAVEIPEEIEQTEANKGEAEKSISSVYRYEYRENEYLADNGRSWQKEDFTRYIYDLAPNDSELEKCYYFTYDNIRKKVAGGGYRKCNANLTITVGEEKDCPSQGENACTLYVYAQDNKSIEGEMGVVTYHIDWEKPLIGKVYTKANEVYPVTVGKGEVNNYKALVSDNTELNYCWFYLDGEKKESVEIESYSCRENCLASLNYAIDEGENHTVFLRCADHYDAEKGEYLNVSSGAPIEVLVSVNHPPRIYSCKVSPSQGNLQTGFQFQIEAADPDNDKLSFIWDFGDGETSNEKNPIHFYKKTGTFEPRISAFDEKGEKAECSTAWVFVSE